MAPRERARLVLSAVTIVALLAFAYAPVLDHDFVDFDDRVYVADNPHVTAGLEPASIRWAFTTRHAANWHPLTWLSHMLDVELYGVAPGAMAATNVVIHAVSSLLLLLFFFRATGAVGPSIAIAALFALHPLRVESVAWIAERKDVLAGLFFMATLLAWLGYARKPGRGRYALVLLALVGGLLSKPTVVTLPFVLLLLDVWPLGRLTRRDLVVRVLEKLPLFALVAIASFITLRVQQAGGALRGDALSPLDFRLANAITSHAAYLGKFLRPVDLAVFYPLPRTDLPASPWNAEVALAALLIVALSVLAFVQRVRRPWIAVGWLWYLGMLVPMSGVVQVGNQAMADRYAYLPTVGLSIPLVFGAAELGRALQARFAAKHLLSLALAASLLIGLALASRRQVAVWRDHVTLFAHALAVTQDNYLAHYNLGTHALTRRPPRLTEARAHLEAAVRLDPAHAEAQLNLGNVEWLEGHAARATLRWETALALDPADPEAHLSLGTARFEAGRIDEALAHFERAIALAPANAKAHSNRATVLLSLGRRDEARRGFERALALAPAMEAAREGLRAAGGP